MVLCAACSSIGVVADAYGTHPQINDRLHYTECIGSHHDRADCSHVGSGRCTELDRSVSTGQNDRRRPSGSDPLQYPHLSQGYDGRL